MSKKYLLMYQDGPHGPRALFSRHRKRSAAEKAMAKALRDPYWKLFTFTIREVAAEEDGQ